eukprot:4486918-Pleurochrysis_carterae.AAC.1
MVKNARRQNNAEALQVAEEKRIAHFLMERGDKQSYYCFRQQARQNATDLTSIIIDKMDGNKNRCP